MVYILKLVFILTQPYMVKSYSVERRILQRSDKDSEDGAGDGGERGGGHAAEEPAAEGALRVPRRRRRAGPPPLRRALAGGFDGIGVVLPNVRLLLVSARSRVRRIQQQ